MLANDPWDKASSVLAKIGWFSNNIIRWISRNYPTNSRKRYAFLVNWACEVGDNLKKTFLAMSMNTMVGHLFQNYDTIYMRFFPTYTCNHSCYTIYVRFFVTYTCVLSPSMWPFSYKRAYICAQKIPYICVTNKHVVYGVTESRRIRRTELYRQQKSPSCTMELKSNVRLSQAWPQWPR